MVTCDESAACGGFRLGARDDEARRSRAPSVSSLSLYKQKIDALFDDSRSVASLPQYGPNLTVSELDRRDSKVSSRRESKATIYEDDDDYCENKINTVNNTVQDRIERMFAEMAGESRQPTENIGVHIFSVHYLGSTPLQSKVTSLSGLQTPLRDLYFSYRKNFRHKNALNGRLEISKSGLKVRYKGEKGDLEQLNPFPTIAVWSAVKFVIQSSDNDSRELSYAFLPLITDPDNIDKHALFKDLDPSDKKYILSYNENLHSPLFAVVMRKIGVAKQLECHGFVCQTTEDAIVIAATLYKSLMSHMSRQGHYDKKKLKNRNGVSCMSVASSLSPNDIPVRPPRKKRSTSSLSGDSDRADGFSASESFNEKHRLERTKKYSTENMPRLPPPPCVPLVEAKRITVEEVKAKLDSIKHNDTSGSDTQGSKKSAAKHSLNAHSSKVQNVQKSQSSTESSVRSKVLEKIELFRELERRKNIQRPPTLPPPVPSKPPLESPSEPSKEPLRRSQSGRKSINESGDILTKVAIPRSGSFLNAGGLTRYKSIGHRNNGKKGGGSPLGFNELFNEFKVQENLHSMDEILNAIIDAEGMSFNDLKPIYKEFLLKLAVTLTKDEIFQHSKAIMKKQKKKILRRNSLFQNKRRKMFKGASGLRMVFRLPFGKEIRRKGKENTPLGSIDFPVGEDPKEPISESSVSTSSYDLRQFRPKEPALPPPKRQAMRQRNSKRAEKMVQVSKRNGKVSRPGERTSTSEDSDFLTLSNRLGCQNRNSSSGYVSCSECESESCIDRCYCSLKEHSKNAKCYCSTADDDKRDPAKAKLLGRSKSCKDCLKEIYDGDFSYCSCDSESCADSNKCYCAGPRRTTMQSSQSLEYLRSPSQKTYSDRLKRAFDDCDGSRGRNRSGSVTSRRREERARRARSSDSLALDYELLLQNRARDTRSRNMQRLTVRSTGAGSQDALSVKKSAEMAALFADVRLSQRTDVRALCGGARARARPPPLPPAPPAPPARPAPALARMFDHRPLSRNASLEDTLGYLP
ncbi:uncharacterized protein LOC106129883 [Amyelois transitella]|uniref:uncharacterized protein LOC106129883 n=1 Tax=Amyelois transitella TaxID=680683 RepID=UPI00067D91CC|nr:uncharacterized protein LOC106129883 [Amyelois transitella]XP_060806561.1 uncharacterized protein LOC106129883 [Amyelois transitella]XP_060806562.1 uncharacterized protein LOC106129883 [Amyelois transitella]XP_060806563.1 uncharacterized protein LOC106129883 [Amyelois transitella]